MEEGEEIDDAHVCLKCHTTILGLDNYVRHRRDQCGAATNAAPKEEPVKPDVTNNPMVINADDFFAFLELQSSSKKTVPLARAMKKFGVLTRSKASEVMKVSNAREMINERDPLMGAHDIQKERRSSLEFQSITSITRTHSAGEKKYKSISSSINFRNLVSIEESSSDRDSHYQKSNLETTALDLQHVENADLLDETHQQNSHISRATPTDFPSIENENRSSLNDIHAKENPEDRPSLDFEPIEAIDKTGYDSESLYHKNDEEPKTSVTFESLDHIGQSRNSDEGIIKKNVMGADTTIGFPIIDAMNTPPEITESMVKKEMAAARNISSESIKSMLHSSSWNNSNESLQKCDAENDFHRPSDLGFHDDDDLSNDYDEFVLSVTDSEDEDAADHRNPPNTHTGGKWNPGGLQGSPPSWSRATSITLDEDHGSSWRLDLEESDQGAGAAPRGGHSEDEDDGEAAAPPPGHTSGKWVPGRNHQAEERTQPLRKFGNTVQYWCGPCNRRLSSNKLYQKHLKSELHLRKTLPERQLDEDTMPLERQRIEKDTGNTEYSRAEGKRVIKPTELYKNSELFNNLKKKQAAAVSVKGPEDATKKKKRTVRCAVCKAIVWSHLMGKHLISRFHSRKAGVGDPVNHALVLENIQSVVQQCPFQCQPCKFYCNTMTSFNNHWRSKQHVQTDIKLNGRYWCSFCKYWCETSSEMGEHLNCADHKEVISIINRSVPIVIFKRSTVSCWTCNEEFRYNIELKKHCVKSRHLDFQTVQEQYFCRYCPFRVHTRRALHYHMVKNHKNFSENGEQIGAYFCSPCGMTFNTFQEAETHRRSQQHKYKSLGDRKNRGLLEQDLTKMCQYCDRPFENILELKTHLHDAHPEHKLRCPLCGMSFVLKQEVSRHVRDKACVFSETSPAPTAVTAAPATTLEENLVEVLEESLEETLEPPLPLESAPDVEVVEVVAAAEEAETETVVVMETEQPPPPTAMEVEESVERNDSSSDDDVSKSSTTSFMCGRCPYKSDSRAEMLFHETLHMGPMSQLKNAEGVSLGVTKYECPLCKRPFRKGALLSHLHTHTNERPFVCGVCGRGFGYRSSMVVHLKKAHPKHPPLEASDSGNEVIRMFCIEDRCKFSTKSCARMENHRAVHAANRCFLCAVCGSSFRLKQNLHQHMKLHTGKEFKCPQENCIYECRSMAELRAHSHVHSDDRPFHCRVCEYCSKTRAQLVRHELIHQGTKDHMCPHCPFRSRVSSHLRRHLRLHTGAKPYHCPYCPYNCNNLENLRKHVLTTNKHIGKMMYECKFCKAEVGDPPSGPVFATNLAATFKRHLMQCHGSQFQSAVVASSYVAGIYDALDDPRHVENPIILPPKKPRNRPNLAYLEEGKKVKMSHAAEGEVHVHNIRPLSMLEELNVSIITNPTGQEATEGQLTMDDFIIIQCNTGDVNGVATPEELEVIRLANENGYFTFERRPGEEENISEVITFGDQDSIMFPLDHQEEVALYSSDGEGEEVRIIEQTQTY